MTDRQRETSVGATAGLPGDNAAASDALADDEVDDTVAMGDVAPPDSDQRR